MHQPHPSTDTTTLTWRKSSHTQANGQCVELAKITGVCLVRDSKNPDGPILTFTSPEWTTFLTIIKNEGHGLR